MSDKLEIFFRMERLERIPESCEFHLDKNGYDSGCWDCCVREVWLSCEFCRELLEQMQDDGYINKELRVCSNSLKPSTLSVREQIENRLKK